MTAWSVMGTGRTGGRGQTGAGAGTRWLHAVDDSLTALNSGCALVCQYIDRFGGGLGRFAGDARTRSSCTRSYAQRRAWRCAGARRWPEGLPLAIRLRFVAQGHRPPLVLRLRGLAGVVGWVR